MIVCYRNKNYEYIHTPMHLYIHTHTQTCMHKTKNLIYNHETTTQFSVTAVGRVAAALSV